jgi:CrcB protein
MMAPSPLLASLYVALGGGAGSVLRFLVGRGMVHWLGPNRATAFPWATLSVNVAGSLAMGVMVGFLARHGHGGETWRLLLGVGVLGGFTTFSSFSMEVVLLMERGALGMAALYAGLSLVAGVGAMIGGLMLMRGAA